MNEKLKHTCSKTLLENKIKFLLILFEVISMSRVLLLLIRFKLECFTIMHNYMLFYIHVLKK